MDRPSAIQTRMGSTETRRPGFYESRAHVLDPSCGWEEEISHPIGRVRDRFDDFVPIESGVTMES